jgi:dTDP-4-amino-4,6-dideoxygalactose transaminase
MNVVNDLAKWPVYSSDEIEAVVNVLKSGKVNYWTGQECKLFEKEYAESIGCQYAISLMNGTVALELALIALDIKPGDEVITPSRTFMASTSCIIARGAIPVFAEVDRNSQNVTAETIEAMITLKTKAVIVVHHAGWPCEMDKIMAMAKRHNIYVIEDCAQAHGAKYKGKAVGSWGDVAAFSFCQDKIITTGGEGGLFTTNNKTFWERAWSYKDHGKDYDTVFNKSHPPGFRWIHASFGSNWRMTEMQAAIGRLQLRKLPEWTRIRTHCAHLFNEAFAKIPALRVTAVPTGVEHANYRYYMFMRLDQLKPEWSRDRVMQEINKQGVVCLSGGCPEVYLEKSFDQTAYRPAQRFPIAKELGETSLALLLHPTLSESEVNHAIEVVTKMLQQASKGS